MNDKTELEQILEWAKACRLRCSPTAGHVIRTDLYRALAALGEALRYCDMAMPPVHKRHMREHILAILRGEREEPGDGEG